MENAHRTPYTASPNFQEVSLLLRKLHFGNKNAPSVLGGNPNDCEACDIDKVMGIYIGSFKLEKTLNFVINLMGLMFYSFYITMKIELSLMTKYFFP